jgi:hypothetical protein
VQRYLRAIFAEWGRPEMVRVDNGAPWGSWSDLPPELALWLVGLSIRVWWNPPKCPQDNGVIERSQGLAIAWGEPKQCRTARQFQLRINHEDRLQREQYPSIQGLPRMTAYPGLKHSGRPYRLKWEQRHWDWDRVRAELAGYAVVRQVDCSGKIGLYHRKLYVGTPHKGQRVHVQFDPERKEWVVSDEQDHQLHRTPADWLTPVAVRTLRLAPRDCRP